MSRKLVSLIVKSVKIGLAWTILLALMAIPAHAGGEPQRVTVELTSSKVTYEQGRDQVATFNYVVTNRTPHSGVYNGSIRLNGLWFGENRPRVEVNTTGVTPVVYRQPSITPFDVSYLIWWDALLQPGQSHTLRVSVALDNRTVGEFPYAVHGTAYLLGQQSTDSLNLGFTAKDQQVMLNWEKPTLSSPVPTTELVLKLNAQAPITLKGDNYIVPLWTNGPVEYRVVYPNSEQRQVACHYIGSGRCAIRLGEVYVPAGQSSLKLTATTTEPQHPPYGYAVEAVLEEQPNFLTAIRPGLRYFAATDAVYPGPWVNN